MYFYEIKYIFLNIYFGYRAMESNRIKSISQNAFKNLEELQDL